jgi:hypothetical protein
VQAAIEYNLKNTDAAKEALSDMPPRLEEELDPVTLHNQVGRCVGRWDTRHSLKPSTDRSINIGPLESYIQLPVLLPCSRVVRPRSVVLLLLLLLVVLLQALVHMEDDASNGFRKLNYLLANPPFPPETFSNLLLLHCKHQYYDLAADILAENSHLTYKFLPQVSQPPTHPPHPLATPPDSHRTLESRVRSGRPWKRGPRLWRLMLVFVCVLPPRSCTSIWTRPSW